MERVRFTIPCVRLHAGETIGTFLNKMDGFKLIKIFVYEIQLNGYKEIINVVSKLSKTVAKLSKIFRKLL